MSIFLLNKGIYTKLACIQLPSRLNDKKSQCNDSVDKVLTSNLEISLNSL